jgi:hypothetical protein
MPALGRTAKGRWRPPVSSSVYWKGSSMSPTPLALLATLVADLRLRRWPLCRNGLSSLELLGATALAGLSTQMDERPAGRALRTWPSTSKLGALPGAFGRSQRARPGALLPPGDRPARHGDACRRLRSLTVEESSVTLVGPGRRAVSPQRGRRSRRESPSARSARASESRLFVSSEGRRKVGQAPFVAEFDRAGPLRARAAAADALPPDGRWDATGVRDNLGFEALSLTPDGRFLLAGAENGLAQESPAAAPGVAEPFAPAALGPRVKGGPPRSSSMSSRRSAVTPPSPADVIVNGLVEADRPRPRPSC